MLLNAVCLPGRGMLWQSWVVFMCPPSNVYGNVNTTRIRHPSFISTYLDQMIILEGKVYSSRNHFVPFCKMLKTRPIQNLEQLLSTDSLRRYLCCAS